MIKPADALEIARNWLEDWNAHDLDRIISHYAEEIVFISPMVVKLLDSPSGSIEGKSALRNYFDRGLTVYPELKFKAIEILVGVSSLVIYYRSVKDLLAAEFMEINQQGLITKANAHYLVSLS
ncbi:MAG: nuclear transport factor 2 family protein [Prochloraceae cyanobacterium]